MIQRKQTLFLIIAVILTIVCMSTQVAALYNDSGIEFARLYNLWLTDGQGNNSFLSVPLFICLLISSVTSIITIFLYMKRKLQATLCLVNIIVLVAWYIFLAVLPQQTGGTMNLHLSAALPACSIILLFMARKGILADEKLVRSLDRIR